MTAAGLVQNDQVRIVDESLGQPDEHVGGNFRSVVGGNPRDTLSATLQERKGTNE
jgi:hypothetical protein